MRIPRNRFVRFALALVAVGVISAFCLLRSGNSAQTEVEKTRRALRQQGFKTELSEFNLWTSPELRARETAITNADLSATVYSTSEYALRNDKPELMVPVASNFALVVWKQDKLQGFPPIEEDDLWPALRQALNVNRARLDAACQAAMAGSIAFNLDASQGNSMMVRHLSVLRNLSQILGKRAVLELHHGNKDAAWTNALALTRFATAWQPEPAEISHLVRFGCVTAAFNTTWQVMQAGDWADERLAGLQHEWESADFFSGLPATAAFTRASMVATCQLERQQPLRGPGLSIKEALRSPRFAWHALPDYWGRLRYHRFGTYEDEKSLLLHYRDRERELHRAVQSPTWSEMRLLPVVTNVVGFQSRYPSAMQCLVNQKQLALAFHLYDHGRHHGLVGYAAEAEVRRRILVTVLALERHRARHGSYPKGLEEIVPELLEDAPIDFMDGKPLRYRVTDDGQFVLYSVGLDCVDNGGELLSLRRQRLPYGGPGGFGIPEPADLVWPLPANAVQAKAHQEAETKGWENQIRIR